MKWFKHLSSAYTDIAIRQVIEKYGIEGYGLFWICCELVAQQGKGFRLKKNQNWLKILELVSKIPEKKLLEVLQKFSELNLIDNTSFKNGDLYLKKMRKYADEYTDKVRRVSRQCPDSVRVEEKRIDKIRREEKRTDFSFKKKPYYDGLEVRRSKGKIWVIPKGGGEWLEFTGKEKDIIYK